MASKRVSNLSTDNQVSLAMIVKPGDGKLLDRCLKNVAKHVDEIIIVTQEENTDIEPVAKKYGAFVHYKTNNVAENGYILDFSAQRNYSFDYATKPWIMWLDSDDTVDFPEKIKEVVKITPKDASAIASMYQYSHDKYGNVTVQHWRERIIRKDSGYRWVGAVHETLIDPNYPSIVKTDDFQVIHHHEGGEEKVGIRNLQILENEINKQREAGEEIDPRSIYYLGVTYNAVGMKEEAFKILKTFVLMSGWDEQRYDAYLQLSEIAYDLNDKESALDHALLAVKEKPEFPDAYYQLGKIYSLEEQYDKAIYWIKMGLEKKPTDTDWIITARKPEALVHLSDSLTNLGRFEESIATLNKIAKLWPDEHEVKLKIDLNKELLEQKNVAESFLKIYRFNNKNDRPKNKILIDAFPKQLADNPLLLKMRWNESVNKWPDKSIVINCGDSFDEWFPGTVDKGIGGSEEAVINMAEELTKLGYSVTVFNNCGNNDGLYNGVSYKNFWEFNPKDAFDILIGWRTPGMFAQKFNAKKKYLWMHDVAPDDVWTDVVLKNVDKVFCLSKYHRELWPSLPEEKVFYTGNGIDPSHFDQEVAGRQKNRLIYSSCPSRGLEHLLDIWPEVKKKYPDAELHYFYGWSNYVKGNYNYPHRMEWMEQMKRKAKQEGIVDHGRVGHKELAKEMLASDIWAYPTEFPEVYCITAVKAQAAGCIPVVIPTGAVDEMVQFGYKTDKEKYLETLLGVMKDNEFDREEMSKWAKTKSWASTATSWSTEFKK